MTLSADSLQWLRQRLHEQVGIALDDGKQYLVESRLQPVVRRLQLGTIDQLVLRLRGGDAVQLWEDVVNALVTTETFFFRDQWPFQLLIEKLIPDLLAANLQRPIRIWSAASASGQEPYSIAIALCEGFPHLATTGFEILATDVAPDMVRRTSEGSFNQLEMARGMSPARRQTFFVERPNGQWQAIEKLRRMIRTQRFNLTQPWPPMASQDIILIRNVLVYFTHEAKQQILGRVRRVLSPDGALILGGAETTVMIDPAFKPMPFQNGSFFVCG
jgi:chemotaxis protein methyltransferase CheR